MKLKPLDKLLLFYLLIIALILLTSCRVKKTNEQKVDSLVKETLVIRDSIRTRTILEYETIYDTIRQQYVTHIRKVSIDESQNKALQATSQTTLSKTTKEKISEPREPKKWINQLLFISAIVVVFFVGFYLRK
jgi:phosphate/sulfate permease